MCTFLLLAEHVHFDKLASAQYIIVGAYIFTVDTSIFAVASETLKKAYRTSV